MAETIACANCGHAPGFTGALRADVYENRARNAERLVEEITEHAAHAAEAMRRAVEEMK